MSDREKLFDERIPDFYTDYEAAKLVAEFGEIVSFKARHAALDLFIIKFVSEQGMNAVLALNPVVAKRLYLKLEELGFGPPERSRQPD